MKTRGRKPGTLIRCRCRVCQNVEMSTGSGSHFRCTACIDADRRIPGGRYTCGSGKLHAQGVVAGMVRSNRLPHPKTLNCTDCSAQACEYEHRDYNHPTKVEPICRRCNLKRGPAIPVDGSFEEAVARRHVPYHLKVSVEKLFSYVGIDFPALQAMPKKLTLVEWREITEVWAAHRAFSVLKA